MVGVKGKGGKKGCGRPRTYYRGADGSQCNMCKNILPLTAFSSGDLKTCKLCKKFNHLKRKYKLSVDDLKQRMEAQEWLCVICRVREPIYIDHCHETGRVRAILCQQCNTGLGYFMDDPEILDRAKLYLIMHY